MEVLALNRTQHFFNVECASIMPLHKVVAAYFQLPVIVREGRQ